VTWVKTNYENVEQLADTLRGIDTVLSFIVTHADLGNVAQKNLIDAAVRAGVRRFAPSEWATSVSSSSWKTAMLSVFSCLLRVNPDLDSIRSSFHYMPWYAGKAEIREYLRELNQDKKVNAREARSPSRLPASQLA
jgi:hypothetical protein